MFGDLFLRSDHLSVHSDQIQLFLFRSLSLISFLQRFVYFSRRCLGSPQCSKETRRHARTRQCRQDRKGKEVLSCYDWLVGICLDGQGHYLTWHNYARTFSLSVKEMLNILTKLLQKYKSFFVSVAIQ